MEENALSWILDPLCSFVPEAVVGHSNGEGLKPSTQRFHFTVDTPDAPTMTNCVVALLTKNHLLARGIGI